MPGAAEKTCGREAVTCGIISQLNHNDRTIFVKEKTHAADQKRKKIFGVCFSVAKKVNRKSKGEKVC